MRTAYLQLRALLQGGVARNSMWILGDKLIRLIVGLVIGVLTARYLGPEKLGLWNYAIAIFSFCNVFASAGLENIVPRELAKKQLNESLLMGTALKIRVVSGFLALVISVAVALILSGKIDDAVLFTAILSLGFPLLSAEVWEYYYQAKLQSRLAIQVKLAVFGIITGYKIVLLALKAPLVYFVLSSTLEFVLVFVVMLFAFKRGVGKTLGHLNFSGPLALQLLRSSVPFAISAFLAVMLYRIDQVMLVRLVGEAENGLYAVGMRWYDLILIVPAAISASAIPRLTENFTESSLSYTRNLSRYFALFSGLAIGVTLVLVLVAPWLMQVLYGTEFNGSGTILQWLVLGFWPASINIAIGSHLLIHNRWKANLWRSTLAVLANVAFNFWLIPRFGALGAAWASALSLLLMLVAALVNPKEKLMRMAVWQSLNPLNLWLK